MKTKSKQTIDKALKQVQTDEHNRKIRKPKFIRIPDAIKGKFIKCLRPKELAAFKYDEGAFLVYGDKRCEPKFYLDTLRECQEKNLVTLVMRQTSKKDFAFTLPLERVLSARKYRLSVAISLPDENEIEFMKSELKINSEIDENELQETFLSSLDDDIIIKDLERIIMLYYQDNL